MSAVEATGRARHRRRGRAAQLRQARRLPGGPHARRCRRRRTRCRRRSPRRWRSGRSRAAPTNPEAWLLTVARRKMIDAVRRRRQRRGAARSNCSASRRSLTRPRSETEIPDHRLALMFACAHPAIEAGIRAPLMLQVVLGLDAKTIASAFLMSPAAMGKRLVRAKDKIRAGRHPFQRARARGAPRPARCRARRHLRRLHRRLDAIRAAPMSLAAISPRRRCSSPGSSPSCCRTSRRRWACSR